MKKPKAPESVTGGGGEWKARSNPILVVQNIRKKNQIIKKEEESDLLAR
jgi:hypothetical protein